MQTNAQGTLAEISVVKRLLADGFEVFLPIGGKTTHDILAYHSEFGIVSIQVKSTTQVTKYGSYAVGLKSSRPNRTETVIHNFNSTAQDILAVYLVELDAVLFYISANLTVKNQLTIKPLDAVNLAEVSLSEILGGVSRVGTSGSDLENRRL